MSHPRRLRRCVPFVIVGLAALGASIGCRKVPPPEPDAITAPQSPSAALVSSGAVTAGSEVNAAATPSSSAATAASAVSTPVASSAAAASAATTPSSAASGAPSATSPASSISTPPGADPLGGKFTLEDATKGLSKNGKLVAEMITDAGTLKCELFADKAPNTVANFIGLARGIRPFKDPKTSEWVKRPAYDNGVFHRIIKGFMIQGGDPMGTGAGEGGFVIPDEVWPGATHDRRGLLCMANRGKNTNSMQFFITDAAAPHLDGGYTIFGSCGPDSVIEKLAATEVRGDRAVNPPKIKKVTVKRVK